MYIISDLSIGGAEMMLYKLLSEPIAAALSRLRVTVI